MFPDFKKEFENLIEDSNFIEMLNDFDIYEKSYKQFGERREAHQTLLQELKDEMFFYILNHLEKTPKD